MSSSVPGPTFALIGLAGYIARRHLEAIRGVGGTSNRVLRHHRLGRHPRQLLPARAFLHQRRGVRGPPQPGAQRPDYFVVCTPNDLHAAHAALGLRIGANVILEKPAALSCRELEALTGLQAQSGHVIHAVLQVRYHGGLLRFRKLMELLAMGPARLRHQV